MRVLIAVPRLAMPGGVSNYYQTLRPYLDRDKVYIEIGGIPGETGRLTKAWRLLRDYWRFHTVLRRDAFDLVHLNPSMDLRSVFRDGVFLLLAKAHRRRVLVFYRGWIPAAELAVRRRYLGLFRLVYRMADANVVLAEEFRQALVDMGVCRTATIETTVVDDTVFRHVAAQSAGEGGAGSDHAACRILFLGRLDVGKGLPEAIDAFELLQAARPEAQLIVAGDGPERLAAEADVARRGLAGITFIGHVAGAAKTQAFQSADLYLFTSLAEGMPNSVLEAMAFGLPIVTRPVGGIRDFFENGAMGFAVDSLNPADFSDKLQRLVANPALRREVGRYNREFARRRFAASVVAGRLLAIYGLLAPEAGSR